MVYFNDALEGDKVFLEGHVAVGVGTVGLVLCVLVFTLAFFLVLEAEQVVHVLHYAYENPEGVFLAHH